MQGFVLLIFCILLLTVVIAKPVKKYTPKYKATKDASLHKTFHDEVAPVTSSADAYKFLTEFGYNPCENPADSKLDNHSGPACQSSIESMLKDFQIAFHLPVTKKLDAATLKLMNTPRCSLPDFLLSLVNKSKLW
jgi:hypothetical protein